jgi:Flp pilus assembly protein TadG
MTKALRRRRDPAAPDEGAAAVEFALLLPIFVMLVFGGISAATIYWHSISATQGARDAARYGATLPLSSAATPAPGELTVDEWLDKVSQVALREAGIGDRNGDGTIDATDVAAADAYLCAAFVKGTSTTHVVATKSKTVSAASGPATTAPCVASDGAPTDVDRVQVVIKRDEQFQAILLSRRITPQTSSVQPYQRSIK